MENENNILLQQLSKHLFWDVNIDDIDIRKHQKFIIKKVLLYGTFDDWKEILKFYGKDSIISISKNIKDLDKKTLSFLSSISGISKTEFLCYTIKQSTPKHWDF